MDITTLQALLDEAVEIATEAETEMRESSENISVSQMMKDIDFNYHLGIEHGIRRVITLLKDSLEQEVSYREAS